LEEAADYQNQKENEKKLIQQEKDTQLNIASLEKEY